MVDIMVDQLLELIDNMFNKDVENHPYAKWGRRTVLCCRAIDKALDDGEIAFEEWSKLEKMIMKNFYRKMGF